MTYEIDTENTITLIEQFITDRLAESGLDGFVIGLSGGIDSALSASLAVRAVGAEKVMGLIMPYRSSSANSKADALELATQLGVEHRVIDISPMIDAYFDTIETEDRLRAGNKMARERMAILFDIAHLTNRMVLGTGNRTEICLGYTTLYGDAACSINPIGELYKIEVRQLATVLDLPASIRTKPPSADLWADQTDEGEIGVTYDQIDAILTCLVDQGITDRSDLIDRGFNPDSIDRVVALFNRNWFKRELPPVAGLGRTAIPREINLG